MFLIDDEQLTTGFSMRYTKELLAQFQNTASSPADCTDSCEFTWNILLGRYTCSEWNRLPFIGAIQYLLACSFVSIAVFQCTCSAPVSLMSCNTEPKIL
jgi:hypothetical protein